MDISEGEYSNYLTDRRSDAHDKSVSGAVASALRLAEAAAAVDAERMEPRRSRAVGLGLCLAAGVLAACAPRTPQTLQERFPELDAKVVMPLSAPPKAQYVRYYAEMTIQGVDDLPFTTMVDVPLGGVSRVIVGVFEAPGWAKDRPGVRVVRSQRELPYLVHGGCDAVNVVIDAASEETIASWCNIEYGPPGTGNAAIPVFIRGQIEGRGGL